MELEISDTFLDYRENVCNKCSVRCNPHYRVCYFITDKEGKELVDGEIELCIFCKAEEKIKKELEKE